MKYTGRHMNAIWHRVEDGDRLYAVIKAEDMVPDIAMGIRMLGGYGVSVEWPVNSNEWIEPEEDEAIAALATAWPMVDEL